MTTLAIPSRHHAGFSVGRANSVVWSGESDKIPKDLFGVVLRGLMGPMTFEPYHQSLRELNEAIAAALSADSGLTPEAREKVRAVGAIARSFLLERHLDIPVPEIDVWENGKVVFEWFAGPRRMVTATLDDKRKLVFAMRYEEDRFNGACYVNGEWPIRLVELVKQVVA